MKLSPSFRAPTTALALLSSLTSPEALGDESDMLDPSVDTSSRVNKIIAPEKPLHIHSFQVLSGGRCRFEWNGKVGQNYRIEISQDLKKWDVLEPSFFIEKPEDLVYTAKNLEAYPRCFFRVADVDPLEVENPEVSKDVWDKSVIFFIDLDDLERGLFLSGDRLIDSDPEFSDSVSDRRAEVEAEIDSFDRNAERQREKQELAIERTNRRNKALLKVLKDLFPDENYGLEDAYRLNDWEQAQTRIEAELYAMGPGEKDRTDNEWNQYFADKEAKLWREFEDYKNKKEAHDRKINMSRDISEINFKTSLEDLFPVNHEINDENRARFDEYTGDLMQIFLKKYPLSYQKELLEEKRQTQQRIVDEWDRKRKINFGHNERYQRELALLNHIQSQIDLLEVQIKALEKEGKEAQEALLLQPEFLQKKLEDLDLEIRTEQHELDIDISNTSDRELAKKSPPYLQRQKKINDKRVIHTRMTEELLTPEVFQNARTERLRLKRNHQEQIEAYQKRRDDVSGREALLDLRDKMNEEERLCMDALQILKKTKEILEKKKDSELPWTQKKDFLEHQLQTTTYMKSWEDYFYKEYLPRANYNITGDKKVLLREHFYDARRNRLTAMDNSDADNRLGKYWRSIISSRTPFQESHLATLRKLVLEAHDAMLVSAKRINDSEYFSNNILDVKSQLQQYSEQKIIIDTAHDGYVSAINKALIEIENSFEAHKNWLQEFYIWTKSNPRDRGDRPLFEEESLADLLLRIEQRLDMELLTSSLYAESHKGVELRNVYKDPEESLAQYVKTMKYFGSPEGKAITQLENQQRYNKLISQGGLIYERYKNNKDFYDPETGEIISQQKLAKALANRSSSEWLADNVALSDPESDFYIGDYNWKDVRYSSDKQKLKIDQVGVYVPGDEKEERAIILSALYTGSQGGIDIESINLTGELLVNKQRRAQGVINFFETHFVLSDEKIFNSDFYLYEDTIGNIFDKTIATHPEFQKIIKKEFLLGGNALDQEKARNLAVLITKLSLIKKMTGVSSLDDKIKNAQEDLAYTGTFPSIEGGKNNSEVGDMYPSLRYVFSKFLNEVRGRYPDKDIRANFGRRTLEKQQSLYSQGRTSEGDIVTNAQAWESYHNYGLALDLFGVIDGQASYDLPWDELGRISEEDYSLEWGGYWESLVDRPHFQNTLNYSIFQLRSILESELLRKNLTEDQIWESKILIQKELGVPNYLFNPLK